LEWSLEDEEEEEEELLEEEELEEDVDRLLPPILSLF
jgi:hypothetical protein